MPEQAPRLVVAADVGGTKTDVGLFEAGDRPRLVRGARYASGDYAGLDEVLAEFLGLSRSGSVGSFWPGAVGAGVIEAAAFAAAGPVLDDEIRTTNLPWVISASSLGAALGGAPVCLLNDLEAAAAGVVDLEPDVLHPFQIGVHRDAHRAILAPGTGLGQGLLLRKGCEWQPASSEGGHVGFAPRDEEQIRLLAYLRGVYPQVSLEHILSGSGLGNLFDFVAGELGVDVGVAVRERLPVRDRAAVIGAAAVAGACPASVYSVALFARILAARAADLTLSLMALGGIYVAGGMVPKLLPAIDDAGFRECFVGRGPFASLLAEVPVHVVLEPKLALGGAASVASRMLH